MVLSNEGKRNARAGTGTKRWGSGPSSWFTLDTVVLKARVILLKCMYDSEIVAMFSARVAQGEEHCRVRFVLTFAEVG